MKALRLGLVLGLTCWCLLGQRAVFGQQVAATSHGQEAAAPSAFTPDFEVKNGPDNGFLVRRKGTLEWLQPGKLNERIAVGLLDGNQKVYVVTNVVRPPKAKHMPDPEYPESERTFRKGWAQLHMVVDNKGVVRQPTVDSSFMTPFAEAAINAVNKWTFEPAQLDGKPVAVLIQVKIEFRLDQF